MPGYDYVVAENQRAHQFRMIGGHLHGQHAAERMAEEHGGSGNALAKKVGNVFRILGAVISASHVRGLAMAAQVRCEDMPAQAQRRNHREKYLPAPAEPM